MTIPDTLREFTNSVSGGALTGNCNLMFTVLKLPEPSVQRTPTVSGAAASSAAVEEPEKTPVCESIVNPVPIGSPDEMEYVRESVTSASLKLPDISSDTDARSTSDWLAIGVSTTGFATIMPYV